MPPLLFPNPQNADFHLEYSITSGHSGSVRMVFPTKVPYKHGLVKDWVRTTCTIVSHGKAEA